MKVYIDTKRVGVHKKTIVGVYVIEKTAIEKRDFNWICEVGYADDEIEAKYLALIKALQLLKDELGIEKKSISIYSDCWMLVNQYNKLMEIKESKLMGLKDTVDNIAKKISGKIELTYIPKEENLATRLLRKQL